ncbi:MAG: hypothetical protein IIA61_11140 [Candidatus Marinimicrobia bacterium]|nr:hypothetical protein [Candidatus Neomarinimicrobiota bacterium]
MKKIIVLSIFVLMNGIVNPAFSLGGFGVYAVSDNFTIDSYEQNFTFLGQDLVSMTRTEMDKPFGLGGFLYIDAIPFIDLEANFEIAGQTYDFTWDVAGQQPETHEVAWIRSALYLTARKTIFGMGLPMLGGIKMNVGGGVNFQASVPLVDKDFMESFLESADAEIDVNDIIDQASKNTGFHLQAGCQVKLLALNLFVNGRYTVVKDVIPDKNGYLSLWVGLAFGI